MLKFLLFPQKKKSSVSSELKIFALTVLVLVSMNIATLVSDSFHTAAFTKLNDVLADTLGSKFTDKMLSRSPTMIRKNEMTLAIDNCPDQLKAGDWDDDDDSFEDEND